MQSGIKHDKHDSKDPRQTLSMLKHDQKLHKAKPKHASMVVTKQVHDAYNRPSNQHETEF